MSLARALFTILNRDPALNAAVGGRIYQDQPPRNAALPALAITIVSGELENHQTGPSAGAVKIAQLDAWAAFGEKWEAEQVRDLALSVCDRFTPEVVEGVDVKRLLAERVSFQPYGPDDEGETGSQRAMLEVRIITQEQRG